MGLMSAGGAGTLKAIRVLNNAQVAYFTIMKSTDDFLSTNGREYHNTSGKYVLAGHATDANNYCGWVVAGRTEAAVASDDGWSIMKSIRASSGRTIYVRTLSARYQSAASGFTINGSYKVSGDAWKIPNLLDTTSGNTLQLFVDVADAVLP